jgi:hypothetical protein
MSTAQAPLAHLIRSRALDWLHTHRRLGALPEGAGLDEDLDAYKAVAEVALAAALTLRTGTAGSRERTQAGELLDFGWGQLRQGALLYERLLHHPLTTDPLESYSHFATAGYRHPGLEELIAQLAASGVAPAVECVPNRRLAIANALRTTGHDRGANTPDWPALSRATWLGNTLQPWLIDWETGYDMTHTVFHLTDWGRLPGALGEELTAYRRVERGPPVGPGRRTADRRRLPARTVRRDAGLARPGRPPAPRRPGAPRRRPGGR